MSDLKTTKTTASVEDFLATIKDEQKQADSRAIVKLMQKITGMPPAMWGPGIVGFDSYHYKYASGREGDAALIGFSPRATALTIYIMDGYEKQTDLLEKLGTFTLGKSCLYIKKLSDIDQQVLEELMRRSVAYMRKTYPRAKV